MARVKAAVVGPISGRLGGVVFADTPWGMTMRELPDPSRKVSAAQTEVRMRLARASAAFRAMTLDQAAAWRAYAAALNGDLPQSSRAGGISAQQAFNALTTKLLQIDPEADIPLTPPSDPFGGDALTFTLAPAPGGVQVTADRPNAPGVVTELMLQRLPSVHCRTYLQRYRTARFTAFDSGLSVVLPCGPGVWAVAARFVRASTGQTVATMEIGVVEVG